MADHVRVSEVDDDYIVLIGADSCIELLGNLGSTHLRLEVICCNCGRRDECTVLILVGLFDTAVEEEGNVSVLLCLSDTELLESVCCEVFAQSVLDLFLLESDELVGDEFIVILEADICERHEAVCSLEVLDALRVGSVAGLSCDVLVAVAESLCDLSCTVRTEVEEDDGVVRLND